MRTLKHQRIPDCIEIDPVSVVEASVYDKDMRLKHAALADAQATIAALQARVRELEQWVQDQSTANLETMRHTDEMQSRALEAEQQLTQRTAECDALKLVNDTHMKTVMKLSHIVEQQTAALEAVRVDNRTYINERHEHMKQIEQLQAELGRVRDQYADLSKLIKALPKVEGEIQATRIPCAAAIGEWWYVGWIRFPNERTAQSYVDLLKHRQGMEG